MAIILLDKEFVKLYDDHDEIHDEIHEHLKDSHSSFFRYSVHSAGFFKIELDCLTAQLKKDYPDKNVLGYNTRFCKVYTRYAGGRLDWHLAMVLIGFHNNNRGRDEEFDTFGKDHCILKCLPSAQPKVADGSCESMFHKNTIRTATQLFYHIYEGIPAQEMYHEKSGEMITEIEIIQSLRGASFTKGENEVAAREEDIIKGYGENKRNDILTELNKYLEEIKRPMLTLEQENQYFPNKVDSNFSIPTLSDLYRFLDSLVEEKAKDQKKDFVPISQEKLLQIIDGKRRQ